LPRPANDDTRGVRMIDVDDAAALARRRVVAIGHAREEELFFDIALFREVHRRGVVRITVIRMPERRRVRDRPGDLWRTQHDVMSLLTDRDGRKREGDCCNTEQTTHRSLPSTHDTVLHTPTR